MDPSPCSKQSKATSKTRESTSAKSTEAAESSKVRKNASKDTSTGQESTGAKSTEARRSGSKETFSPSAESVNVRTRASKERFSIESIGTSKAHPKHRLSGRIRQFKEGKKTKQKPSGSRERPSSAVNALSNEKISKSTHSSIPTDGHKRDATREDTVENESPMDNDAATVFAQIASPVRPAVSPLINNQQKDGPADNDNQEAGTVFAQIASPVRPAVSPLINKQKKRKGANINVSTDVADQITDGPNLQSTKEQEPAKKQTKDKKETHKDDHPKNKTDPKDKKDDPPKDSKPVISHYLIDKKLK